MTDKDMPAVKTKLNFNKDILKKLNLVAVAYSFVDRAFFPTEDAYTAEKEVEDRAREVMAEIENLGLESKGYPADQYLLTNILVDRPDVIVNLVDTVRGKSWFPWPSPFLSNWAWIPTTDLFRP